MCNEILAHLQDDLDGILVSLGLLVADKGGPVVEQGGGHSGQLAVDRRGRGHHGALDGERSDGHVCLL